MNNVLRKLSGGDLRSEGKAEEVALEIIKNPSLLNDLLPGLDDENKVIRARVCMTMEIISREHSELLSKAMPRLVDLAAKETVAQARWHLAEVFGNMQIRDEDVERIAQILLGYLEDKSKIVKYCSVQTLGILGRRSELVEEIVDVIQELKDVSKSMNKVVSLALQNLGFG